MFFIFACSDSEGPGEISYENDIQVSIFNVSCLVGCHDGTKQAGVELTSWETMMEGGDRGQIVIAGNAEESPLVWSLKGIGATGNPVSLMPPVNFPQISRTDIRIIERALKQLPGGTTEMVRSGAEENENEEQRLHVISNPKTKVLGIALNMFDYKKDSYYGYYGKAYKGYYGQNISDAKLRKSFPA